MRIMFIIIFLSLLLHSKNIEQLIQYSLTKHPSLHTINYRLSQMDEYISLSENFDNPDLSFIVNDIQFQDPLSRDLEPMQFQAINIKQKFPWFGKLEARKSLALSKRNLTINSYDAAKVQLAYEIRTASYTLIELQKRIQIVKKYEAVSKQNIELYTSYASTENKSHSSSMSASLSHSKIKIRYQKYLTLLNTQKSRLKYLTQSKVETISDSFHIKVPKPLNYYLKAIENNPNYTIKLSEHAIAMEKKKVIDLDHNPDPYVQIGYYNRQEFPDYASVNVGFSLPLYDTESLNSEISRKEILATSTATLDYKSALLSQIEIMHLKLNEAYEIIKIIEKESLPQLEHMFELSQSSIQNGANLFNYTNLLEQKLALEEENISIKASYLRTEAKLKSLIGEL